MICWISIGRGLSCSYECWVMSVELWVLSDENCYWFALLIFWEHRCHWFNRFTQIFLSTTNSAFCSCVLLSFVLFRCAPYSSAAPRVRFASPVLRLGGSSQDSGYWKLRLRLNTNPFALLIFWNTDDADWTGFSKNCDWDCDWDWIPRLQILPSDFCLLHSFPQFPY